MSQPWRTEPEIAPSRQAELAERCRVAADAGENVYPFKGLRLGRADVEWLLVAHEEGRGPVDAGDPSQNDRVGVDLRGADLSYTNLSNLPMARTGGVATKTGFQDLSQEQRRLAAINFRGANLAGTRLDDSLLDYADMASADLSRSHLTNASLWGANFREAYCDGARFNGADLWNAHFDDAFLFRAHFEKTRLHEAYLSGAHFNDLRLADEDGFGPMVADIHWEGVNLAVVYWTGIRFLGDDRVALAPETAGAPNAKRRMESAIRANQQLALALQAQGITDEANRFFFRARVLNRKLLRMSGPRKLPAYLASLLLDALTGYGYRMGRMIGAYIALIALFALLYLAAGQAGTPHMDWSQAALQSITAFHGRVFEPSAIKPDSAQSIVAAFEAVIGFLFEGLFIAMLAQRVFGR